MDKGRWGAAWSAKLACTQAKRSKKAKKRFHIKSACTNPI
jgi:hypothetical protein